jgi:Flp pilus assembly pilin Flp
MDNDEITTDLDDGPATDRGATLVEYGLLLALLVVVCITAVNYFGSSIDTSLSRSNSTIAAASD